MEENKMPENNNADIDINADADIPGNTHLSNPETDTDSEIEQLQAELQEQKDKYLRLFAEFDNFRRRSAKERIELNQTAGREIIVSLLEIMDDCDRAEKQMKETDNTSLIKEGNLLVFNKLRSLLQQKGLSPMESLHSEFDVEKHEAITELEAGPELKGKVVDELVKGYYLNDKIIRFAKVVVGK